MKAILSLAGALFLNLPLIGSAQAPPKYIPPLANGLSIGLGYGAYLNFSDVTRPPKPASTSQFKEVYLKFAPDLLLAYTWRHKWRLETGYSAGYTAGGVLEAINEIGSRTIFSLPIERVPLRLERHFHPGNGRWSLYPQVGLTCAFIQKYNQDSYSYTYQPIAYAKPELGYQSIELEDLGRYRMVCFELGGGANCQLSRNLSFSLGARYSNRFGAGYVGRGTLIWQYTGGASNTIVSQTRLEGVSLALALRYRITGRKKDALEAPLLK